MINMTKELSDKIPMPKTGRQPHSVLKVSWKEANEIIDKGFTAYSAQAFEEYLDCPKFDGSTIIPFQVNMSRWLPQNQGKSNLMKEGPFEIEVFPNQDSPSFTVLIYKVEDSKK